MKGKESGEVQRDLEHKARLSDQLPLSSRLHEDGRYLQPSAFDRE